MGLKERIQADMQKAAKERNSLALSALRMALAAIKNKEIEERGEIGEDSILKVLATMVKQRKESIDLFRRGGREDLAGKEAAEIVVLEAYLPKALSDAEIETLAREAVGATGAKSPGDMGRVMKELMPKVAGRADGKTVNEIVRRLLAG
ncbi:MAG TPA: GatB/YqeY domain-containing protein [Candidatus Deferrimicrobiaceae bacterium]|nr:GatB/YqeY domain-containing protein [Candidatus Deferrimicrobiaceae bacterium]